MSTFVSYAIIFTSFDADYYYGQFVRKDEQGRKHHISNIKLDLDSGCESLHLDKCDEQSQIDFEVTNKDSLEEEILTRLLIEPRAVFQAVKQKGEIYELTMLD